MTALDPNSFANVHEMMSTSLHLDLVADFDRNVFKGSSAGKLAPFAPHRLPFLFFSPGQIFVVDIRGICGRDPYACFGAVTKVLSVT